MAHRIGPSRGDRRRNARKGRLRRLIPRDHAIVGIDLADAKQVFAVCDHDGAVHGRRTVRTRAWQLAATLGWAREAAVAAGFAGLVVACEPTGHRWRTVLEQCDALGLTMVCVSPMLVSRERERDDLTPDRSDAKDAVLIAGLAAQLRCYEPERPTVPWARLRAPGGQPRRAGRRRRSGPARIRSLLECAWPAALEAAAKPLDSSTWRASMAVILSRCVQGDAAAVRRMGWIRFQAAVRREMPRWGSARVTWRIARALWEATTDPTGVAEQRHGALERTGDLLVDWQRLRVQRDSVQARMVAVLDELDLTALATSIPGLSAVGAAAILAHTGDPTRFDSARALVKHAGLAPRDNESGTYKGTSRISGRGRPELRLAAWRVVWGALPNNPVLAARYQHPTTRETNRLTGHQARVAVAGALLRQLHAVTVHRVAWNATTAAGGPKEVTPAA
jgi:transposase